MNNNKGYPRELTPGMLLLLCTFHYIVWFFDEIITNEELLSLVTLLARSGYHDIDKENEKIKKLQH